MIQFQLVRPNVVVVSGIDTTLVNAPAWHHALHRFGEILQVMVSVSYSREQVAGRAHFLANSVGWNLRKARMGADARRGHQWGHIQSVLGRATLFGVSSVVDGAATITFSDRMLQALAPHAYHYARRKVPGGIIMALNPAWLPSAGQMLRLMETRAWAERARQLRGRPERAAHLLGQARRAPVSGRAGLPRLIRKPLTLALTAWDVTAKCAARLALLGRS